MAVRETEQCRRGQALPPFLRRPTFLVIVIATAEIH
jgi:hypothetical protein